MLDADIIAMAAMPPGKGDHTVGHGIDGGTIAGGEVDARMHSRIAQDRVAALAIARRHATGDRSRQYAAPFTHARRLEPFGTAVPVPFEHRDRFAARPVEARIEQVAHLHIAGFGAAIFGDDVVAIALANAAQIDLLRNDAQKGLHRLGWRTRRAGRPVDAVADHALDTQRRIVDADRDALHRQHAAIAGQFDAKVQPRAEGELVERPGPVAAGATAKDDIEPRARLHARIDVAADHRHDGRDIAAADAGARQGAGQGIATADLGAEFDLRAFGRFAQRLHGVGRPHMPAAVRAHRQRRNHLAAHFVIMRVGQDRAGRAGNGLKTGGEIESNGAQAKAGGQAAEPGEAADALAKVGNQFHILSPVVQAAAPVLRLGLGSHLPIERVRQPEGCGCTALLRPELPILKQKPRPPRVFFIAASATSPAPRVSGTVVNAQG